MASQPEAECDTVKDKENQDGRRQLNSTVTIVCPKYICKSPDFLFVGSVDDSRFNRQKKR